MVLLVWVYSCWGVAPSPVLGVLLGLGKFLMGLLGGGIGGLVSVGVLSLLEVINSAQDGGMLLVSGGSGDCSLLGWLLLVYRCRWIFRIG